MQCVTSPSISENVLPALLDDRRIEQIDDGEDKHEFDGNECCLLLSKLHSVYFLSLRMNLGRCTA